MGGQNRFDRFRCPDASMALGSGPQLHTFKMQDTNSGAAKTDWIDAHTLWVVKSVVRRAARRVAFDPGLGRGSRCQSSDLT
jgi:hypothetical protein